MQLPHFPLSPFQLLLRKIPEHWNIFLGGGRGGAKSYSLCVLAIEHCLKYGKNAHALYIRRTHKATEDFEILLKQQVADLSRIFGYKIAKWNGQLHVMRFKNGAILELGQLDNEADYSKYHGSSYSLLLVDEAGENASLDYIDRLQSCLRKGGKKVPQRSIFAANPGGVGHQELYMRYVAGTTPWKPFKRPGKEIAGIKSSKKQIWIYCPSTYKDNPFIEHEDYLAKLLDSAPEDPELVKAWVAGDWDIQRGSFFSSVLSNKRNLIPAVTPESIKEWRDKDDWQFFISYDYGTRAPAVAYLVARSPGMGHPGPNGQLFPKGSLLFLDEWAAVQSPMKTNLNRGLDMLIHEQAVEIKRFADKWDVEPVGPADDAIFNSTGMGSGSLANEFKNYGVDFSRAEKGQASVGWQLMRQMLKDAGQVDINGAPVDKPGIYVCDSSNCPYFWLTVPFLKPHARDFGILADRQPDHAADTVRYAATWSDKSTEVFFEVTPWIL